MWIIFFQDAPHFWLVGDMVYKAGSKDTHILIESDRSISRTHLTMEVGSLPWGSAASQTEDGRQRAPAALTLIDSSTYGTVLVPCGTAEGGEEKAVGIDGVSQTVHCSPKAQEMITRITQLKQKRSSKRSRTDTDIVEEEEEAEVLTMGEQHTLQRGTPFRIPLDRPEWRQFTAVMGNHGAALRFCWVPLTAIVEDLDPDWMTKLEHSLSRCGVQLLSHTTNTSQGETPLFPVADYLITPQIQPSAAVVAMLCKASPIVTPEYFTAIKDRPSPRTPLPSPTVYRPPLADFWEQLLGDRAGELLLPLPARSRLFHGVTFVVFQPSLYEEVVQYIPCAHGRVVWDNTLSEVIHPSRSTPLLSSFFLRHQRHILLYNPAERMPFRHCLSTLVDKMHLYRLEYAALIESIALVRPLEEVVFPSEVPDWDTVLLEEEEDKEGRVSDGKALYPNPPDESLTHTQTQTAPRETNTARVVREDGWIVPSRRSRGGGGGTPRDDDGRQYAAVVSEEKNTLPPYPCFHPSSHPSKRFQKQKLRAPPASASSLVELDRAGSDRAAPPLTTRGVPVFAEDMISSTVRMGGVGVAGFNPFDLSVVNASHRKKGTAPKGGREKKRKPQPRQRLEEATSAAAGGQKGPALPYEDTSFAEDGHTHTTETNNNTNNSTAAKPAKVGYDIFDIDGMF